MSNDLHCYHCGTSLERLPLPLGRRDECPECERSLHVCRMCVYYDPHESTKQCTEDDAEEVKDKKAANFCEYFKPDPSAFEPSGYDAEQQAARELDSLFGDESSSETPSASDARDEALKDAEALFKK